MSPVSIALPYHLYHRASQNIGDIDPSYKTLLYICDRFELNTEQRFWLAFIYSLTYCGASTFYVYNEFPDFECVNLQRMQRWWGQHGRKNILCQTDRRWVKANNLFVPAVEAWIRMIGGKSQSEFFQELVGSYSEASVRYRQVYKAAEKLPSFGQFSLFLLTEALHTITTLDLMPTELNLNEAWSCRNGLCHAYELPYITSKDVLQIPEEGREQILSSWEELKRIHTESTVWQLETTLCAYAKWSKGARYIGYYLDRQAVETAKMEAQAEGVCWDVLWQQRAEEIDHEYLVEFSGNNYGPKLHKGIPDSWKWRRKAHTRSIIEGRQELP